MTTDDGMFDPLQGGRRSPARSVRGRGWRAVVPVPGDAPPPPAAHPTRRKPVARWAYRDKDGALLGYVLRFDGPDGAKDFPFLTWCEPAAGGPGEWRWKSWDVPRPLYGLDRLAARPEAPVIVAEGEKAADAAGELLPEFVAVTSPGGSKAAAKADWTALARRRVVVWPDADAPGGEYADAVYRVLAAIGVTATVIPPPADLKSGWDAADALVEGWDEERARALVDQAAAPPPRTGVDGSPERKNNSGRGGDGASPAQRDRLVGIADEACELWHCPNREPFASVPVDGHLENFAIRSKDFKRWVCGRFYDDFKTVPASEATEAALRVIEMKALRGALHETFIRIGEGGGVVYLDLGAAAWGAVQITATEWKVIDEPPVKFLRSAAMRPLPVPEPGDEGVQALRPFVNVAGETDFKLMVGWLVGAFRPQGPYAMLLINGEQGTAKSTTARMLLNLIDPRAAVLRGKPRDERDLAIAAHNSWCMGFDNLSKVNEWESDAFCRLATGGGFATRELHSDREETIFDAQRPLLLNGIPDLAARPDLGDRAVVVTLAPIARQDRRPETEMLAAFEDARPGILGALLDGVVAALSEIATVEIPAHERMADFAQWVTAAEPGLGWEGGSFMEAYAANRAGQIEIAVESDPVASALRAFAESVRTWEGSASELLPELDSFVTGKVKDSRAWPATPLALSNRVRRAASGLRELGIDVKIGTRATTRDRKRLITVRYSADA